jgi:hypothetical protein
MRADYSIPEPTTSFDALLQGLDPETADQVLRDCRAEVALWQHHLRVQETSYASDDPRPRELFRIG